VTVLTVQYGSEIWALRKRYLNKISLYAAEIKFTLSVEGCIRLGKIKINTSGMNLKYLKLQEQCKIAGKHGMNL
jgi:hypothetical protein